MAVVSKYRGVALLDRKYGLLACEPIAVLMVLFGTIATIFTQKMILYFEHCCLSSTIGKL